jgi:hypothetical protein
MLVLGLFVVCDVIIYGMIVRAKTMMLSVLCEGTDR